MLNNNIVLKILKFELIKFSAWLLSTFHPFLIYIPLIKHALLISFLIVVFFILIYLFIRFYLNWQQIRKPTVFFEVAPPSLTEQSSFTTTQLFTAVHGLLNQRSRLYRLFDVNKSYAFELTSTKKQGIRYILRLPSGDAQIIKKNLIAYLPGVQINKVNDYLTDSQSLIQVHILEFGLSKPFAYPLKKQDNLKEYDPISYITATMTKLSEDEQVSFQVIASSLGRGVARAISRIKTALLTDQDILESLRATNGFVDVFSVAINIVLKILALPLGIIVWIFSGGKEGPLLPSSLPRLHSANYSTGMVETQVRQKIDQPLFSVSLRLMTQTNSVPNRIRIEKGFMAALSLFTNGAYQSLKPKRQLSLGWLDRLTLAFFKHRLLGTSHGAVLSSSELSDLYHFPFTATTKTENLLKIHSKQLPAPLSLKKANSLDVVFAKNTYGGNITPIGLTLEERRRHVYILGATGTGKSTMLLSMVKQDMEHGKGMCVVDPHGDLIDQVLSAVPRVRIPDIVYFNPDDISYPMGINLLERTKGLTDDEDLREKEFLAESIVSVFQKIYSDRYSGPRMEYILRNSIHTAFSVPNATLFTVYKLLINTAYRRSVTRNLTDENLKDFWKYEFSKAGDYQRVKMISPITNKIGRFLFSPTAKRILEQPTSTINFDSIMNDGKILLCNLSKGKIGEDNSSVFGVLIMAKIQLAALKRARMKPEDRKDFYLYVDEFQNFATPAFAQVLSEARKYRLSAVLAHQTTSQIEENSLVNVTLANTGTVICFRTANPEDERIILPQFRPYVEPGEIASLPSFRFYMRLGALIPEEPFSGVTVPASIQPNPSRINEIIVSSRKLYTKEYVPQKPTLPKKQQKTQTDKVWGVVP